MYMIVFQQRNRKFTTECDEFVSAIAVFQALCVRCLVVKMYDCTGRVVQSYNNTRDLVDEAC